MIAGDAVYSNIDIGSRRLDHVQPDIARALLPVACVVFVVPGKVKCWAPFPIKERVGWVFVAFGRLLRLRHLKICHMHQLKHVFC